VANNKNHLLVYEESEEHEKKLFAGMMLPGK
jgi:hypothetical protein